MLNDHKKNLEQQYSKFQKAPKFSLNSEQLYCVCRKPDNGELMVACDGCDEWFHFKCMHLDKKYKDLISKFYCVFCDELFGRGKTQYKRKCRLPECYKPARVDIVTGQTSKYCCDAHGVKFMKDYVVDVVRKSEKETKSVNALFTKEAISIANYSEFKALGMTLPIFDKISGKSLVNLMSEQTKERLASIDVNIGNLEKLERTYESKLKYLMKLRGLVKKLNEQLTKAILDENTKISSVDLKSQNGKGGSKRNRNGKNGKASKRTAKTDICGYDTSLQLLGNSWIKFTNGERYKSVIGWDNSFSINEKEILTEFKLLRKRLQITEDEQREDVSREQSEGEMNPNIKSDGCIVDKELTIFCGLCVKDRKKCSKHLTWYTTIYDSLDSNIASISEEINTLRKEKDKVKQEENIQLWEKWRNNPILKNESASTVIHQGITPK